MTNLEYSDKVKEYNYLLKQKEIRPLQDYELDRLSYLEKELQKNNNE